MNKIRLAFLGCGDVAQRDYLPELHRLADRMELTAVCSRTVDRARAVAQQYGAGAWYTSYEQMLAETDADAVVNLTPMQLHAETTLAALEAGRHVYTEKPVATSAREAARIAETAKERGLTVVCAPCVLLFPQVRYARSLLNEGSIGLVRAARGLGLGGVPPWSGYLSDPSPFFAAGGGPLRDMGVYPLHALTGLLGPARRVSAFASHAQRRFMIKEGPFQGKEVPVQVPVNWHLLLDFGGGRQAAIEANNCVQGTRAPQLELFGRQGTIALDLIDVSAPVEVLRAGRGWETVTLPRTGRQKGPDHLLGIEHLVDCLQDGTEPVLSLEHAHHVVEIIDKAEQSAAEGRALELESTFQPRELGLAPVE
jgi:predicted dehydrogenase